MADATVAGNVITVAGPNVMINGTPWHEVAAYAALTGSDAMTLAVAAAAAVTNGMLTLDEVSVEANADYARMRAENEYCTNVAHCWFLAHLRADGFVPPILVPNPDSINVDLAVTLARSAISEERQIAALSPQTPGTVLIELAHDRDLDVRAGVAGNPATPCAALEVLAHDQSVIVRAAAAGHAGLSTPTLTGLTRDPNRTVRAAAHAHSGE